MARTRGPATSSLTAPPGRRRRQVVDVADVTRTRVAATDRLQPSRRLDRQLHLDRQGTIVCEQRQVGAMQRRSPARQLAEARRGDQLAAFVLTDADLAL